MLYGWLQALGRYDLAVIAGHSFGEGLGAEDCSVREEWSDTRQFVHICNLVRLRCGHQGGVELRPQIADCRLNFFFRTAECFT